MTCRVDNYEDRRSSDLMLVCLDKVFLELFKLAYYSVNRVEINAIRLNIFGKHSSEYGLDVFLGREQFVLALDSYP